MAESSRELTARGFQSRGDSNTSGLEKAMTGHKDSNAFVIFISLGE
jgi:hypothetical protein